jgi:hypothetical protein
MSSTKKTTFSAGALRVAKEENISNFELNSAAVLWHTPSVELPPFMRSVFGK